MTCTRTLAQASRDYELELSREKRILPWDRQAVDRRLARKTYHGDLYVKGLRRMLGHFSTKIGMPCIHTSNTLCKLRTACPAGRTRCRVSSWVSWSRFESFETLSNLSFTRLADPKTWKPSTATETQQWLKLKVSVSSRTGDGGQQPRRTRRL